MATATETAERVNNVANNFFIQSSLLELENRQFGYASLAEGDLITNISYGKAVEFCENFTDLRLCRAS